ncbi:hypothetical protein [Actinocrinis sp.]|uniref:hypothetical protein n=1 Tax=Actinocrinis sp. TaxID=1920516 RepID=UPI002B5BA85F|nr:hypothetical protein [Actinocrinis sp.]HXR73475.1 hypothetical protein [Actinocrinis sp.]
MAFKLGHKPDLNIGTRAAADVWAVIEAVSNVSEERDAAEKFGAYAEPGIPNYWIIRRDTVEDDGVISMHELVGGAYKITGTRLVSQLAESADDAR